MSTTFDPLPARDLTQGEPRSFTSLDGTVHLHIDVDRFDFYIEAREEYAAASLTQALSQAEWWGLEPIEDQEPIVTHGGVRIYLAPIIPVEPLTTSIPRQYRPLRLRYAATALAGAAVSAGLMVEYIATLADTFGSLVAA
jgi:hypothetical protein